MWRITGRVMVMSACLVMVASTGWTQPFGAGTIAGTYINPDPPCPPAACSGVGTSSVFWGTPDPGNPPNGLAFTGRGFAAELGEPFVLGLIQYQNSSTTDNIETIDFRLQSTPTNGDPIFAQTTTLTVSIVQTINSGNPVADADYIFFRDFPQFGSFRVFEGQVSTVELVGAFNSLDVLGFGQSFNLGFVGFGDVGDPNIAFTNPSVVPALATPSLNAPSSNTSVIPEPPTIGLLALGIMLGGLLLGGRLRAVIPG
jgi:hypothetical protein